MSNWIPANAKLVRPYDKTGRPSYKNFENALTTVLGSGTRNANFVRAVNAAQVPGTRIGARSSYGTVTRVGPGFVIKKMNFPDFQHDYLKIFLNEVRVGSIPGIKAVGPRVYAWRVKRDIRGRAMSGEMIMDDFTFVPSSQKVMQLAAYSKLSTTCYTGDPVFKLIKDTMVKFWSITKGYHGDLHTNNMAVVLDVATKTPVKVIVFDYGAHQPFLTAIPAATTCYEDFIKYVDKEFGKPRGTTSYPVRGQPFKSNANLLNWISLSSSSKTHVSASSPVGPRKRRRRVSATHVSASPVRPASTTREPGTSVVPETSTGRRGQRSRTHVSGSSVVPETSTGRRGVRQASPVRPPPRKYQRWFRTSS
jgi:hypothetical protein